MRLDKDYLMEMELWPHFEMRGLGQAAPAPVELPIATQAERVARVARVTAAAPAQSVPRNQPIRVAAPIRPPASPRPADPALLARIAGADWNALQQIASGCQACALCGERKNVVFGVGPQAAHWLFIGESPGAEEDQSGEPFVGQAGKLLDAMLGAAGLARGREVYLANVVKCRPPGRRTPLPEEALACAPLLDRQIDLIQPKIIVALGKTAIARLIGSDAPMVALRGRVHQYRDIPVIATYHPAYLLRNLPEKLKAWEDLQLAKSTLAGLL